MVIAVIAAVDSWPEDRLKEKLAVYDKAYLKKMLKDNLATAKKSLKSPTEKGNYLGNHAEKIQCPILHINGDADNTCTKNHAHQLKTRTKNSRLVKCFIGVIRLVVSCNYLQLYYSQGGDHP